MTKISNIFDGIEISRGNKISEELTADEMAHMKFALMTSVVVERNFCRYKTTLADYLVIDENRKTKGRDRKFEDARVEAPHHDVSTHGPRPNRVPVDCLINWGLASWWRFARVYYVFSMAMLV